MDLPNEKPRLNMAEVKEELLDRFDDEGFGLKRREVSVMCRLSGKAVAILDALVELEIFKSKSEAIAAFLDQTFQEKEELFEEILTQAHEINAKREAAKHLAYKTVMSRKKSKRK
jgi:Arc/MetJ-type ribon-helix-helix transcriptional regulator